jgi:hypothetical protein
MDRAAEPFASSLCFRSDTCQAPAPAPHSLGSLVAVQILVYYWDRIGGRAQDPPTENGQPAYVPLGASTLERLG